MARMAPATGAMRVARSGLQGSKAATGKSSKLTSRQLKVGVQALLIASTVNAIK
jgi:hypothetical protein